MSTLDNVSRYDAIARRIALAWNARASKVGAK